MDPNARKWSDNDRKALDANWKAIDQIKALDLTHDEKEQIALIEDTIWSRINMVMMKTLSNRLMMELSKYFKVEKSDLGHLGSYEHNISIPTEYRIVSGANGSHIAPTSSRTEYRTTSMWHARWTYIIKLHSMSAY